MPGPGRVPTMEAVAAPTTSAAAVAVAISPQDGPVDDFASEVEDFDEVPSSRTQSQNQNQSHNLSNVSETYSLYIPPRTGPSVKKRKKSKNRRRHSETIWTIVSEQENFHQNQNQNQSQSQVHYATTGKIPSKSKKSKDRSLFSLSTPSTTTPTTPATKKKGNLKKGKKSGEESTEITRRISFLDNPIFETDLKNWTLPRVELWCRDPDCQINIQLWREYCQSHQDQLTQLQFQELQGQNPHYQHTQFQHFQQPYFQPHPYHPPSQRRSSTAEPIILIPTDLPAPHTFSSRRQRLSSYLEGDSSSRRRPATSAACHHHQPIYTIDIDVEGGPPPPPEEFYGQPPQPPQPLPRNCNSMQPAAVAAPSTKMSIGHSMNNLNQAQAHQGQDPSNTSTSNSNNTGGRMGRSTSGSKNIVPTGSSSSSSSKTDSTQVQSSSSSSASSSASGVQVSSSSGGGGKVEDRDTGNGSYSSSGSSEEDVSSGSTFVTGFDSSESRGSSVPSSLNKPPHPNLINHNQNNHHNHKSHTSGGRHHRNSNGNKSQSQIYGDLGQGTIGNTAGYTLPYMPAGCRKTGICPSCNGLVPPSQGPPPPLTNHHLVPVDPLLSSVAVGVGLDHIHHSSTLPNNGGLKSENNANNAFWNFAKFQHPLQRDHSFHSVGGFTLNGQYNTQVKKRRMVRICSSHKIALVVSTFSLMVTVGLIITLILMKKRGMMDTMDMMPT